MKAVWAAAMAMAATIGVTSGAEARISGPYQSGNLSVFLVHAEPTGGGHTGAYLTLDEALASNQAAVYETGDVNELEVENKSKDRTLFIHLGRWETGKARESKYASCAVRTARFRLVNDKELYDIAADPGETRNLYFERPEIVKELKALLDQSKASGRSRPERPNSKP